MKNCLPLTSLLALLVALPTIGAAADNNGQCREQAEQILARLQAEAVGKLSSAQRTSAQQIVLDVCQTREQQVEVEVQQAVQRTREEEQAKTNSWLTESADKPGNKRLKRKSH